MLRFPTTGATLNLIKLVDAATSFVILHAGPQQIAHLKVPMAVEKADPWRAIVHRRLTRYTSLVLTFIVASVLGAAAFEACSCWSLVSPVGVVLVVTADCYAGLRGASMQVQPAEERWAAYGMGAVCVAVLRMRQRALMSTSDAIGCTLRAESTQLSRFQ